MRGCPHNAERTIDHRPSGEIGWTPGERNYQYGDVMILVCPHGCEDVEIVVGDNREDKV